MKTLDTHRAQRAAGHLDDCGCNSCRAKRHDDGGERKIVEQLVRLILDQGCMVSVYDGEEFAIKRSVDRDAILAAMFSTDSDTLYIRNAAGTKLGVIALIYGNGRDVISDHSDNDDMNSLMARMSEFTETLPQ